jgi:hypothetical protein
LSFNTCIAHHIFVVVCVSIAKDEEENIGVFVGYLDQILRRVALRTVSIMNVNLYYAGLNMFFNVLFAILIPLWEPTTHAYLLTYSWS